MKIYIIIFVLISNIVVSQNFNYESKLTQSTENSFYKIVLNPNLVSKLKSDCSDLRIYESENIEVPYILKVEVPFSNNVLFKEYEIISKTYDEHKGITRIVVKNSKKLKINNFCITLKNAEVYKYLTLNGSDNNKDWYIIKNDYYFTSIRNSDETSEVRILDFPLSDYEYFEISIYDCFNAPLNVLNVGYYDLETEKGQYLNTENPVISQKDSSEVKESYIKLHFSENQYIDKINIKISSKNYFYRNARLYKVGLSAKNTETLDLIKNIDLCSCSYNTFYLNNESANDFLLIIQNNDNQPIKIDSIHCYQLIHSLLTPLEKDKSYVLKFGDKSLKMPVYDLKYFQDSITKNIPVITSGDITKFEKAEKEVIFYMKPVFLWITIGIVMIILGFMSFKMLREMKNRNA